MMMSEQRRSTLNDVVKIHQPRKYKLSIYEKGNVLTLKSESPLLENSRMESFDFPLRESSNPALNKASGFGSALVKRVEERVVGATNITLQLYEATVTLDGIYNQSVALEQMEKVIQGLCNDAWLEPTITTELRPKVRKNESGGDYVHPFGKLSLRLHEQRQRGQRKIIR